MGARPVVLTGTVDIEAARWDRPVVAVAYQPSGTKTFRGRRLVAELVDYLRSVGGCWWAWGGGRYDTLAILDELLNRGSTVQCSLAGSAISRAVVGSVKVLDAMALVPFSLPVAAQLAGLEAPRGLEGDGWQCRCRDLDETAADCGGYCRITERLPPYMRQQLEAYCAHDCRVAYDVIAAVLTRWSAAGLVVKGTLGGTAWATAQAWAGLPDAEWRVDLWRLVRRAYYGGRTIIARPYALGVDHFDIASAYPAALASTALPIGQPIQGGKDKAAKAYRRGLAGVYKATVTVEESAFIPPLPWRDRDGRIYYGTGTMRGWWTAIELAAAEDRGATIDDITECVAWKESARVLEPVVTKWYGERMRAGRETAWGDLWNALSRSLTGKLAQQPEMEAVLVNARSVRYCAPWIPSSRAAGCTRGACTGRCQAYRQLDSEGRVWAVPIWRLGESSHVQWAAYLTAATRIQVGDGWRACGRDLVYGATDSAWSQGKPPGPLGDALGDWRKVARWGEWTCRGPGTYRGVNEAGEVVIRAGGVPRLSDAQWAQLAERDAKLETSRGVLTLKEAAPGGKLFKRRVRDSRLPHPEGWYGDRLLRRDGLTYPVPLDEARVHFQKAKERSAGVPQAEEGAGPRPDARPGGRARRAPGGSRGGTGPGAGG